MLTRLLSNCQADFFDLDSEAMTLFIDKNFLSRIEKMGDYVRKNTQLYHQMILFSST